MAVKLGGQCQSPAGTTAEIGLIFVREALYLTPLQSRIRRTMPMRCMLCVCYEREKGKRGNDGTSHDGAPVTFQIFCHA